MGQSVSASDMNNPKYDEDDPSTLNETNVVNFNPPPLTISHDKSKSADLKKSSTIMI